MSTSTLSRTPKRVGVIAVVVLYKMRASESPTLRTLLEASSEVSGAGAGLELAILIQDNTPGGQDAGDLPAGARYEAAPENPGLASAYNWAMGIAHAEGYSWLLTLDQDTLLPKNFLARISELAVTLEGSPEIAAIVPQITDGGKNLSPFRFAMGAVPRWFPYGFTGILPRAYALNSAATIRVTAIREISGYDPMFPLDCSDINLFHRIHLSGKRVFLAGDLLVSHDFSMLKKHSRLSIERYRSLLLDECAFWDIHMGAPARAERMVRLAVRALKDLLVSKERAFGRVTLEELKRRIATPRARRVAEWRRWATARCGPFGIGDDGSREMV